MIQDVLRNDTSNRSELSMRRSAKGFMVLIAALAACSDAAAGDGKIRHRAPDRGTYQPPVLESRTLQPVNVVDVQQSDAGEKTTSGGLVNAPLVPLSPAKSVRQQPGSERSAARQVVLPDPVVLADSGSVVRQASHEQPVVQQAVVHPNAPSQTMPLSDPVTFATPVRHSHTGGSIETCSCESCAAGAVTSPVPAIGETYYETGYGDASCDGFGCDSLGCDSIGCGNTGRFGLTRDQWFGSIELLLMFRSGDRLPALVTSGPDTDSDTAGELGQADTVVLFGQENVFQDMTAGGRFTLGSWLDCYKDRSIVARGWFAGEESVGFSANQNTLPVITRPFLNVTGGGSEQDTQVIAFPDRATGDISVQADSNVFGADISMRQLWYKRFGGTIDLLYGYQYMGMDQSLSIASTSTSINDDFAPVGAVISVADQFDIENDFHGGQIGIASHYREGCWSFSTLAKLGFGSVRRRATLNGLTQTSIDGNNAIDPNGLLVRASNAGTRDDNTFGWVPELDFTLGWQKFPSFDITFGYHIIAMTDALEISGAVDPNLAVSFDDGAVNPAIQFSEGTFYVQGLHFGLTYIR